ncbi:hypothetical protein ScPMuIL_014244 [Solemya velum]
MKCIVFLVAVCLVACAVAATRGNKLHRKYNRKYSSTEQSDSRMTNQLNKYRANRKHQSAAEPKYRHAFPGYPGRMANRKHPYLSDDSRCSPCVHFAELALDSLVEIFTDTVIPPNPTCYGLCRTLHRRTQGDAEGLGCKIMCSQAGIDKFIQGITSADRDPINFCQTLQICPVVDNGDVTITQLAVSPSSAPQGNFDIEMKYSSDRGSGTGKVILFVDTVDGVPFGQHFLKKAEAPGNYKAHWSLNTIPDPQCDPTVNPARRGCPERTP